jgi:hypothetical protein
MTESKWLACADHQPMLEHLHGKASGRKLRLFAVACCRHYGHLLRDERCQNAVQVAERFSDGLATAEELWEAGEAVWGAAESGELGVEGQGAACAYSCYRQEDGSYPSGTPREVANQMLVALGDEIASDERYETECGVLSNLLRCIIGNPFRPVTVSPAWQTPQVIALAQAGYEHRDLPSGHLDPTRLAILADALEDAGCTDQTILNHLRGPGPHVRGCWAVDLILGKQ